MNPFRECLKLGYEATDQGRDNATYVLLSLAADVYDGAPAFVAGTPLADPYAECVRLLGKYADCDCIKQLAQELPTR